jgi:hypothetical protein
MYAIVCEDRVGKLKVGEVVSGPKTIDLMKRKGVALLPFDPEIPRDACSAYMQKFFGQGWLFDNGVGERGCQMVFQASEGLQFVYWAARIRRMSEDQPFNCSIRLVHASEQSRGMGMGMNQVAAVTSTPRLDEDGSVVVYGKSQFTAGASGLMFTDLYCVARGLMVEWVAVTQCGQDYAV